MNFITSLISQRSPNNACEREEQTAQVVSIIKFSKKKILANFPLFIHFATKKEEKKSFEIIIKRPPN